MNGGLKKIPGTYKKLQQIQNEYNKFLSFCAFMSG